MNSYNHQGDFGEEVHKWMTAQACQDVVLRFMALFDMRALAEMKELVTPDLEWQRPDLTIRGVAHMIETLSATPNNVRVRHVITNLRTTFNSSDRSVVDSYFTVYRLGGTTPDIGSPVPLDGPMAVGRYRDELVLINGSWRISSKITTIDFRRNQA
jgi:hypothetical protein